MLILLLVLLGFIFAPAFIPALLILLLLYWQCHREPRKRYEESKYFAETHNEYRKVHSDKGTYGEYLTRSYLQSLPGYKKFLHNCYLPKDNGETTEIDLILLHESGIYVFESKNYSGWIFGAETQQYWTQTLSKGRHRSPHKEPFFNPIIQNKVHIKWLSTYLGMEPEQFFSYIVFSERCTLKDITLTSGHHHVLNRYDVLSAVSANAQISGVRLTPGEIDDLYSRLYPLTQIDQSQKLAHIENIQRKKEPQDIPDGSIQGQMICPRCGAKLVLRTAARGALAGNRFLGCSRYPHCRYIRTLNIQANDHPSG